MAIRLKHLDLNVEGFKRQAGSDLGAIAAGVTTKTVFVAPVACKVESIDLYGQNAFSANTSDTIAVRAYQAGASGSSDKVVGVLTVNTSAATNAYSALSRIRITPSANNSLTQGAILMIQISAVCQAIPSGTYVHVTFVPLNHRESR